jgi:diphthine synthase
MTLSLISVGLADEKDMSLRALEEARGCDALYAELYTMKLATPLAALTELVGKPVTLLPRGDLEEHSAKIIDEAKGRRVGVLIGGDCLSATTHISLLLEAAERGVETRIVHGSSIFSAVTETGLSLYKFGRTVTMPFPEKGPADAVLRSIQGNLSEGLHTLVLLDLDNEQKKYMSAPQAIQSLIDSGVSPDTLVVGVARLGQPDAIIRAGRAADIASHDFGEPPHSLVVPGLLHFLEEDALRTLARCPPEALKNRDVKPELDRLIDKYIVGCRRVRETMTTIPPSSPPTPTQIQDLLDHVDRYLADAEYYRAEKKPTALTSVAYAEGILDALKLLGIADFQWWTR